MGIQRTLIAKCECYDPCATPMLFFSLVRQLTQHVLRGPIICIVNTQPTLTYRPVCTPGAGRLRDGTPFLVTEYCSLGSVAEYIHNPQNELDLTLKLRFALDAAKGMRFLHYCNPPRIHRDLKPGATPVAGDRVWCPHLELSSLGNLLVSSSMSVKVADLGTSRLLRDAVEESNPAPPPRRPSWSRRKTLAKPRHQGSESDPLLPSSRCAGNSACKHNSHRDCIA